MAARPPVRRRKATGSGAARKASPEDQFMAAAIGDVEWLRQSLREPGASAGAFDRNGLAAVHLAAIHGRLECLRLLIEQNGCDVNSASSTGWRPVHLCISAQTGPRSLQCLLYLLDKGADHSCVNDDFVTPVHQAASEGHLQALQLLIKLGAKLDQTDIRGFRPIDMAKIWGHRKCAKLLATETWHREKDQVARKLKMEKRLAMKDLLKQFEKEEQVAHDMRYQGNEAFNEWVQQVEETKVSHKKRHRSSEEKQPRPDQQQQPPRKDEQLEASPAERYRQPTVTEEDAEADKLQTQVREVIDEANEILGERGGQEQRPPLRLAHHPQDWNHSTKVSICFNPYQPRLEDVYPRDNFTRLPHPANSYPLRLNVRSRHPEAALAGDSDRREMRDVGAERRDAQGDGEDLNESPEEEETKAPRPRPASTVADERPFREQLFACKSVLDIQRRKRLDEVVRRYRGEAAAHLTSDSRSFLFRDALGLETAASAGSVAGSAAASKKSSKQSSRRSSGKSGSQPRQKTPMASHSSRLLTPELKA
ncbi:hypothetical protein BOX15_Mlig003739g2 [Macrostomum lignano]|uniref:ANK_REP_REGION domain-containing protein n=2 Tax=Macrostomum lignano TaxID=282301 RepID=A0A1I8JJ04_9PLAT|nr:hypothetical protein BOX15_Mlig003739g2 [Macrostomum lignano]